ncbi:MAG: HEAT repeat domain-containing protein [Planctomycetota bacterium]|jgi:hypothetical protein
MRTPLLLIPLLLAAAVLAQQATDVDDLVAKLGHDDYEVRESATQQLIDLGEKAVPALEKALQSEDLEVRLRAGRALRAIRGEGRKEVEETEKAAPEPAPAPGRSSTSSGVEIQVLPGKVKVRIHEDVDGKKTVKEYEGASIEELKRKHPELRKHLGNLRFQLQRPGDPFDMEKFWKNWHRDFNDDFMRRWRDDARRDMERLERWLKMLQEHKLEDLDRSGRPGAARDRPVLGMRATRPDAVLDAQLQLQGRGLVVVAVEKDTLADALGLRRHDVLIELNGQGIEGLDGVARILRQRQEGGKVTAKVVRRAKVVELSTSR